MTVIGIDPSSKRIAAAIFEDDEWFFEDWIAPKKLRARDEVLAQFVRPFVNFIESYQSRGDLYVFVEDPVVGVGGPRPTIVQAQVQGLILGLSRYAGADGAYAVNVQTWKKDVVGGGNASKAEVAEWLANTHPTLSELAGDDQDFVDAACIALYGIAVIERGERLSG